jgi:hypothetical protein
MQIGWFNSMIKPIFLGAIGTSTGSSLALLSTVLPSLSEHTDVLVALTLGAGAISVYFFKKWMNDKDREIEKLQAFRETLLLALAKKYLTEPDKLPAIEALKE